MYMNNNTEFIKGLEFTNIDSEEIPIDQEAINLKRKWTFWETYEHKSSKDYKDSIKNIITFSDIISFWQFWNNYKGSEFNEVFFNGETIK